MFFSSSVQSRDSVLATSKTARGLRAQGHQQVHSTKTATHSVPNIRKKYPRSTPETSAKHPGRLQTRAQIPKESDPCPLTGDGLLVLTNVMFFSQLLYFCFFLPLSSLLARFAEFSQLFFRKF